ncbi:MAG: aminodeoxychorismate synthase component I [Natronospirillum sp.]|uniref:aminodeoxychorismate synthase component I n=1 Tax=Natronospirillum sp. TaxID=2812955 RepID=UPI0025EB21E3|nr:aminodeoxychorismate synthase component I [Natronospirillum sp.]MCH8552745.1 aminodeoxychorismate synthase component I [Natronospirillum sp.]
MTLAADKSLDPLAWLNGLRERAFPVLLDSGQPGAPFGRYAILAAEPKRYWQAEDANTLAVWQRQQDADGKPIYQLAERLHGPVLGRLAELQSAVTPPTQDNGGFNGGLIGLLPYELGSAAQQVSRDTTTSGLPASLHWGWVGDYDRAIVIDHAFGTVHRLGQSDDWQPAAAHIPPLEEGHTRLDTSLDRTAYLERMARIRNYLQAGDIYQVNLTRRFTTPWSLDPVATFTHLRSATPMPFAGYLDLGEAQVLSLSPERFLQVKDGTLETKPIKGTRPRGKTAEADGRLRDDLFSSLKDRAENLMIVDLLRNDLGRTAVTGSVRVPRLFDIESFANVHQLVSTITARLPAETPPLQALLQAFPGGSITGAPKKRAMEIITELEPHTRGPYCGSLFYQDVTGRLDSNILIRTAALSGGELSIWSGGGIVWDSDPAAEYQETHDKIGRLVEALGLKLP